MKCRYLRIMVTAIILCSTFGCAINVQIQDMVPQGLHFSPKESGSVFVRVKGAGEGNTFWRNQGGISDNSFRAALQQSIRDSGLFSIANDETSADHILEVLIHEIEMPQFGQVGDDAQLGISSRWRLFRNSDQAIVFERDIRSSQNGYSYQMLDEAAAAARKNISTGLNELSQIDLDN